jgi:hypothetical protein
MVCRWTVFSTQNLLKPSVYVQDGMQLRRCKTALRHEKNEVSGFLFAPLNDVGSLRVR